MKTKPQIVCAIYTRTASITGTGIENRLNDQREAAEAYIATRAAEGLVARPERYDDNGRSGNTADRPALQWLMRDVAAGKVERVVVERYDRLARSPAVFAELVDVLQRHGVELVSATQPIAPDLIGMAGFVTNKEKEGAQ